MEFQDLRENWDALGETDPYWAILSVPETKGGKWDVEQFFLTGVRDVEAIIGGLHRLQLELPRGRALDFGCGVGRITQALVPHFETCVGVDIAPSMVRLALELNRWGARCDYQVNDGQDLSRFSDKSFDFVVSLIVLQHMRPAFAKRYVSEFVRVLAPGGIAIFQVPSGLHFGYQTPPTPEARIGVFTRLKRRVRRLLRPSDSTLNASVTREPQIEMHGVGRDVVHALVGEAGGTMVSTVEDAWAGEEWSSYTYIVTRPHA